MSDSLVKGSMERLHIGNHDDALTQKAVQSPCRVSMPMLAALLAAYTSAIVTSTSTPGSMLRRQCMHSVGPSRCVTARPA